MNCYSQGFRLEGDNNPHPSKAYKFTSLHECISKYEEYVQECDNFGFGAPAPLWVYLGEPDGDEVKYGYPDCCDFIIRIGPRGGIIKERCQ